MGPLDPRARRRYACNVPVVNRVSASTAWRWLRPGREVSLQRAHPLGPIVSVMPAQDRMRARLIAGMVLVACGSVLGIAVAVTPDPSGLGTHRQLGLGRCNVVAITGYPCPTCGMTTAFAHAVRGQMVASFEAQPAGMVLAVATLVAALLCVYTLATSRVWTVNWYRISPMWVPIILAALVLSGWVYKLAGGIISGQFPM